MTISTRYSSRPDFRPQPKTQSPGDTATSPVGQSPAPTTPSASTSRTEATGHSGESSFEPTAVQEHEPGPFQGLFGPREYVVPSEHNWREAVPADEKQRTREIGRAQEQLISGAGGEPVQFTNANGQTEALQFTRESEGYRVADAHGNSILVRPQEGLSEDRLLESTAEIADYWSQTPAHLRHTTPVFDVSPGELRATYNNVNGDIVVKMGARGIDERTFDHEMGHGIGWALEQGPTGGRPEGWDAAMQADGTSVSRYANGNEREDFAESWLAYVEARELGPDQLSALQQSYPNRFAILEQVYNGTLEP